MTNLSDRHVARETVWGVSEGAEVDGTVQFYKGMVYIRACRSKTLLYNEKLVRSCQVCFVFDNSVYYVLGR